jgi:hypothetical protein
MALINGAAFAVLAVEPLCSGPAAVSTGLLGVASLGSSTSGSPREVIDGRRRILCEDMLAYKGWRAGLRARAPTRNRVSCMPLLILGKVSFAQCLALHNVNLAPSTHAEAVE